MCVCVYVCVCVCVYCIGFAKENLGECFTSVAKPRVEYETDAGKKSSDKSAADEDLALG